jgi:hypothetical protein
MALCSGEKGYYSTPKLPVIIVTLKKQTEKI